MTIQQDYDEFHASAKEAADSLRSIAVTMRGFIASSCYRTPMLVKQRAKLATLIDALDDFIEYMATEESWCKVEAVPVSPFNFLAQANEALDELLRKL